MFLFLWLYSILTYVGKILDDFSGIREPVRMFYTKINGNFIFDLRIFTLQTVFIERITFVNRGMGVIALCKFVYADFYLNFPFCIYTSTIIVLW
jgi:hypothetical protein